MGIHEEGETPTEVSIVRKPLIEQKTYVIVENHVRELTNNVENKPNVCFSDEKLPSILESNTMNKVRKSSKKGNKGDLTSQTSTECDLNTQNKEADISKNDLNELKTVYEQCRAVVAKIEKKYGHLLNIYEDAGPSNSKQQKRVANHEQEDVCQCTLNKKLIFDDDGQQIQVDSQQDTHICPKKLKKTQHYTNNHNIQVEYPENELQLSDNLQELANILENHNIEITYRNKVIDKVKAIRQEYLNEIRFNKHALIEKLKTNADELLDFKGTNLSSLPGYL